MGLITLGRRIVLWATAITALITPLFAAQGAFAFSAYGNGTADKPYLITSCQQLQDIDNDLSAHYMLMRNINCADYGGSFESIGQSTPFSGTLDGNYYTIDNLTVQSGMFFLTSGATIENLRFNGGSALAGAGFTGSLAVVALSTTIENVYSSMSVFGSEETGGLIGEGDAGTHITTSAFYGTLNGSGGDVGGLAGALDDSSTITDSYARADFLMSGGLAGGLVGVLEDSTINRAYSASSFFGSADVIGGLTGFNQSGTINDSFAANTVTATATNNGGIAGLSSSGGSHLYFASSSAGASACGDPGTISCTAVAVTPTNFINNAANHAVDSWDFGLTDFVWVTQANDFPHLYNLDSNVKGLLGFDLSGNGLDDSYDPQVASTFYWTDNQDATVTVPSSTGCVVGLVSWGDVSFIKKDSPAYTDQFPAYISYPLYCADGASVPVTIIFDKKYDTTHSVLRHFDINTHAYSTLPATFGTIDIHGTIKTTATFTIKDGGPLDSDGTADGIIHDPVGLVSVASAPSTGLPRQSAWVPAILITLSAYLGTLAWRQRKTAARAQ